MKRKLGGTAKATATATTTSAFSESGGGGEDGDAHADLLHGHHSLVLIDQLGKNYTFYTFVGPEEKADAEALLRRVQGYLREASRSKKRVTLSILYDTSYWEEHAMWVCLLVLVVLSTIPCNETITFDANANLFVLTHHTWIGVCTTRIVAGLDAVSHIEMTQEQVLHMNLSRQPMRTIQPRSSTEYAIRLYIRTSALSSSHIGTPGACGLLRCSSQRVFAASEGARLATYQVGWGHTETDPANMKRAVEAVSAMLLDQAADKGAATTTILSSSTPSGGAEGQGQVQGHALAPHGYPGGGGSNRNHDRRSGLSNRANGSTTRTSSLTTVGGGASEGRCIICLQARARVVFFPCKHMCVCRACAEECSTCPVCRGPIAERHTLYW